MSFRALSDTGNFLRDPLTGKPVVLADSVVAASLLGLEREALRHRGDAPKTGVPLAGATAETDSL